MGHRESSPASNIHSIMAYLRKYEKSSIIHLILYLHKPKKNKQNPKLLEENNYNYSRYKWIETIQKFRETKSWVFEKNKKEW